MDNNGTPPAGVMDRRPDALGDLGVLSDEILCSTLEYLTPRDVARLACVSSVMYVLCNEEPLWMSLCLQRVHGPLQYTGSWKRTTLQLENVLCEYQELCHRPRHFEGFSSWFLYRRLYRCHTTLNGFNFEDGNVDRKNEISVKEFSCNYDGKKPVLLTGLADTWPARQSWTTDQLLRNYGDMIFKISQRSAGKVVMKFKDYVSYMNLQHDEDPLYIFDDKFGEVAPDLLKDFSVPYLFQEDLFDILDRDQRPAFRWFISGPERSGASWHVDPALTSAWNTLLCGRKRWALYPPGRVPAGVTVHVNEDDGDVNIETPSSLQWWLDFYPLLADEDKPIECTQLPGETIFVPSGWWHCVLNLETTVAVTQNFVNSKNFEFVCLDMAPGYHHKGVCRAGLLALDEDNLEAVKDNLSHNKDDLSYSDQTRKEKRIRILKPGEGSKYFDFKDYNFLQKCFSYDINFLSMFLDKERDHYNFPWSLGNSIGQREMREWLYKLWVGKPGMRELIWKGACLALDAGRWLECLVEICTFHKLPSPAEFEKLPVGTGSNPVHLVADFVIKIFVEGGLEPSIYGLGTELEFYSLLHKAKSPLQNHVPEVLTSGILYIENGSYKIIPWDGNGVPDVIARCDFVAENCKLDGFPFGAWRKKQHDYRKAGMSNYKCIISADPTRIWPYIITKRCRGQIFAELRDSLSWDDMLSLASFLGEQLCNLHLLPQPPFSASIYSDIEQKLESHFTNGCVDDVPDKSNTPAKWDIFIRTLNKRKKDVSGRLTRWGDPIPETLIEKIDEYIPHDITKLLHVFKTNLVQEENVPMEVCKPFSWIHSDIMEDNIHMEPCDGSSCLNGTMEDVDLEDNCSMNGGDSTSEGKSWRASHLLDFSDLSLGDPLYDIIPIHLDVFRGDPNLFKQFLESYKLPLVKSLTQHNSMEGTDKFGRLSYHAMSYCILHEENVLGAIFSIWDELKVAKSWEEVELTVWGELNNYKGIP